MMLKARQAWNVVRFTRTRDKYGPILRPRIAHCEHIGHCTLCWLVFLTGHSWEAWAGGATGAIMLVHVIIGLGEGEER